MDFVKATTDPSSPNFVPPEARIATFDQDGTLWVEHPLYSQVVYCLDRVPALVKAKPELANVEPFKTVLSGDREAMAKLSTHDLEKILFATLTGMTVGTFEAEAKKWTDEAKDGRWKRPYTELTYQPMQEVLSYLRANGFKTYIVTGGGQDFVRVYSERVYGIPPEQVVGTAGGTTYSYDTEGKPILTLQVRARRFHCAQRAGADLGRGVVEEQRRDQVPPVEALEQIDRMQHMPRVRMPEFLDERFDREQVGARMPQVLRLDVVGVEAPPERHHVAAFRAECEDNPHRHHGDAGVADLRPGEVQAPRLDQHEQDQRVSPARPIRSTVTSTNGFAFALMSPGNGRKRISREVLSTV